jgi:hypothetical protein
MEMKNAITVFSGMTHMTVCDAEMTISKPRLVPTTQTERFRVFSQVCLEEYWFSA